MINVKQYLQRIHYTGKVKPNYATLEKLQRHHLFAIPFENLDIYYGIPIHLDQESVYNKVVNERRGGYCYELNSLFYALLLELGFETSIISGRLPAGKDLGPQFDHMALLVTIAHTPYLVDVGFGDFSVMPLAAQDTSPQNDGYADYKIIGNRIEDGNSYINMAKWNAFREVFVTEYLYSTKPARLEDFLPMHTYQQTNDESHFTRNLICSKPTAEGRISIVNSRLVITTHGMKRSKLIHDDRQKQELLKSCFDIDFPIPVLTDNRPHHLSGAFTYQKTGT